MSSINFIFKRSAVGPLMFRLSNPVRCARRGALSFALCLFLLMQLLIATPTARAAGPARRPNLLIILADDLGYGDLSAYGARDLRTPNIDALIADGMRLDNFYANSPVCSPSRAALMTGRYPDLVGVPGVIREDASDSWGYLSPGARLLPQVLKGAGYRTALIGKWHLGLEPPNLPNERGFDYFHGFLGDMMDDYYTHLRGGINYLRENNRTISPEGHATDLFTRWATDYLRARKNEKSPFFLYLAYNAPHVPVQPPAEWVERVRRREPDISAQRLKLVALIEHLDDSVGRVIEALKTNGQYENTLIVFTSDNGGQLNVGASNGPLRGGKEEMYEGGIRVPMCAVWRGHIRPQTRSERTALLMDLWPTLCEAAGLSIKGSIDGVSILPFLLKEGRSSGGGGAGTKVAREGDDASGASDERTLFWMRREGGGFYIGKDYYAVRRGPWKLVQNHPYMPFRLYNLTADPLEQHDLAAENRKMFDELGRALRTHLQQAGAVPWQRPASAAAAGPETR